MAKRIKGLGELRLISGFTSVQIYLESKTSELKNQGLLIAAEFIDEKGETLGQDEVKSSYSKALQAQYRYIEKQEDDSAIFQSVPFTLSRPAYIANFKAIEWGRGFSSEKVFLKSLAGLWMIFENSENGTSWTYRMGA